MLRFSKFNFGLEFSSVFTEYERFVTTFFKSGMRFNCLEILPLHLLVSSNVDKFYTLNLTHIGNTQYK